MREMARHAAEDEAAYTPYELDGADAGEIQLLRKRNGDGGTLFVGFYRCPHAIEGVQPYEHDEAIYVFEGEVDMAFDDGPELHLGPGDMATFRKGTQATFRQSAGFKKFFVMSE